LGDLFFRSVCCEKLGLGKPVVGRKEALMPKNLPQFGELPPQYNFFLNPYEDQRFTRCPQCETVMGQRKVPLVIHVDPHYPLSINYTCRYCSRCDLLIAHQHEIERLLAGIFAQRIPEAIGNDYLVLGTFDRAYWKEGTKTPHKSQDLFANLHDFKQVLKFDLRYGWVKDKPSSERSQPAGTPSDHKTRAIDKYCDNSIIDDRDRALALVAALKEHLPVQVRPTKALIQVLRKQGLNLSRGQSLQIRNIFYAGDEGGITCDITPPGKEKQPVLCSLTHLEIQGSSPLEKDMQVYQQLRLKRLARQ
jgi:hypothetical protein